MTNLENLPNLNREQLHLPNHGRIAAKPLPHKPRILLLYGSLRERSYSRLVVEESARLLQVLGAEIKIFDPRGLPQPDTEDESHSKVKELRDLMIWSEGQVWCSPERHESMTGIFKSQIDWCR